jgi:hypothetical protein
MALVAPESLRERDESAPKSILLVLHSVGDHSSNLSVPNLRKGGRAPHRHDRAPSHLCRGLPLSKTRAAWESPGGHVVDACHRGSSSLFNLWQNSMEKHCKGAVAVVIIGVAEMVNMVVFVISMWSGPCGHLATTRVVMRRWP